MTAFAYPINIVREPKEIRYTDDYVLPDGLLTLDMLSKLIGNDDPFSIHEQEVGNFATERTLTVFRKRFETKEELDKRVEKQEKYMRGYYNFHRNKK